MAQVANVSCRMMPAMMLVWARECGSVRMTWPTCDVTEPEEAPLSAGLQDTQSTAEQRQQRLRMSKAGMTDGGGNWWQRA